MLCMHITFGDDARQRPKVFRIGSYDFIEFLLRPDVECAL